jgi:hypothetical protein
LQCISSTGKLRRLKPGLNIREESVAEIGEVLTKIYNTCLFIYENIQHMDVFTKISTVNDDSVAGNTAPATGTPTTPQPVLHVPATS